MILPPRDLKPTLARPGTQCPRTHQPCNCQPGGIDHQRCTTIAQHGDRHR